MAAKKKGGARKGAGRKRQSLEDHVLNGTYRADRHGPLVEASELCSRPEPMQKSRCGRAEKWARNKADERAVANGCWFDERRAAYVVQWFREHLQFSDSDWAGKPFELLPWQRDEIIYPLFGWMRVDERGRTVRRFNRTYIEIPKKNGKSTIASGIGLYMLVGEGNRGNEVYSAATDKDQASIVHGEAIRMVEASEKLSGFLKVNYSTRHIYNREHHVTYRAVSSRPQGNEGLKGNTCIIDELHAWHGDELWNALRYMGVNWPERLIFVITTAGDDTESICYKQYEIAKSVERGEMENERLLVCIHEAAADDDIEQESVQRKANPSLGHTILAHDLRDDVTEAKRSARTLATLKRYRFNVWQTVTSPWLDLEQWKLAAEQFTEDDLLGLPCWAGLDLARKSDMTALALVFQRDDKYLLFTKFWLPDVKANEWAHLASYHEWARAGELRLTEGDVAEFPKIEEETISLLQKFRPRSLRFDEKYAEEITQRIYVKTGVTRVAFAQTMTNFTGPSTAFERMLAEGKIKHNGNRLLAWQAGNVEVKSDMNQNIRPVKEERGSHKSIDGIVAGIMALAGAMEEGSVYEDRGVFVL